MKKTIWYAIGYLVLTGLYVWRMVKEFRSGATDTELLKSWVVGMSLLTITVGIAIFYPFKKGKWSDNVEVKTFATICLVIMVAAVLGMDPNYWRPAYVYGGAGLAIFGLWRSKIY